MYLHLTVTVLFESCLFKEYKYRLRNRRWCIVTVKYNKKLKGYELHALTTPLQNSVSHVEEKLHWSLPIWLPYMVH